MKKLWKDEKLILAVKQAFSFEGVCYVLGLAPSNDSIRKRITELGLSTEHWYRKQSIPKAHKIPLEEILIKDSSYTYTSALKQKLVISGLMENKCVICGTTEWMGKPISLQLDHINGDRRDNRIGNLRILCPNCHSQTDTYSGKNTSKEKRKCREKVRYACPYCGRLTHDSKRGACQKCMVQHQLGTYRRKLSAQQEQEVKRKRHNGMSLNKLAKRYAVSRDTITKIVRDEYK
jgi:5-methylcytosine-specific restriction endonuclease McrA